MKKLFSMLLFFSLFFICNWSSVSAEGANYGMTPIGTSINETDKTVTLVWQPKSGSKDMEILVSRDGGNEYESLDIVPITDGKYVYNIQCGEPTLWFQIYPRNEDGHPGKYKVNTKGVGSSCEGSTYGGADFRMHAMFTSVDETKKTVTLNWNPLKGSKDVEIYVSRDGGNEYESLDIVPMDSKNYTYEVKCGEPILWFKFVPRNGDGIGESYKVDTKGVGSSCEGSTYGGADFRMHAMFTSTDETKKTVTLNWNPLKGSKDVEISVAKYGENEYVVLDTVPMDSKSYTYKVPCGLDTLSFKFTPRNGDGISESYKVNTHGVGGKCEGADMTKANISYYLKDNTINLTWNSLTGSKNIEIFVERNGDSVFKSLGTVSMNAENFKYSIQDSDKNLIFKFVPKDNSGTEANYAVCVGEDCTTSKSVTSELLGQLSHTYNTGNNTIIFKWTRNIEGIDIIIAKIEKNKYQPLDTVPMEKGEYKYFLECGDEDIEFQFSAKRVKGYEFTYTVSVQPDEKLCEGKNKRNRTMAKRDWYLNGIQSEILSNGYTREMNNAFKFGIGYGLISAQNIDAANLNGEITRAALAKMISKFAENVLGKTSNGSIPCYFSDIPQDVDNQYSNGISKSCKLGIMGVGISTFKPYDNVLRAEFGTILSRLVFGVNDGNPYYQTHLNTLKSNGIMSNIDPFKVEKRGNVLLMLMRTAQKIGIQDLDYSNTSNTSTSSNSSNTISNTSKKSDNEKLIELVELIDPTLVNEAKNILTPSNADKHNAADGADMSLAKITHFIDTGNNIITLFWNYVPYSNDVEIRRFDPKAADYIVLGTVPMYQEYFQYQANNGDSEILFAFIPKNAKGREYRYDANLKSGNKNNVMKFDLTPPFVELKKKLGNTSVILEKLIPTINSKSESTRKNIIETLGTYTNSNDSYMKNIGTYLLYLLN